MIFMRYFFLSVLTCIAAIAFGQSGDGVLRVLAIGNSFSEDAVEHYLHELGVAAGKKMVVGNLYIGGAPLSRHWDNVLADEGAYRYRKTAVDGSKHEELNVSISAALADEAWDYISLQQASSLSGRFEFYEKPLAGLFGYIKGATGGQAQVIWHQTWAYAANSTHDGFVHYDRDQLTMYEAIMDASRRATEWVPIDLLVPSGTAIQNARTSFIGDNLTRDGYHLDLYIGRFTAACTWFEALFGQRAPVDKFRPENVSVEQAKVAQQAAQAAVTQTYEITDLGHELAVPN